MRKSTLALIIVITALMFYTGCDDGGGEGQGRQGTGVQCPGGGVPPEECDLDRCPCDFYSVPMTEQCWGSLGISPTFESSTEGRGAECSLFPVGNALSDGLAIFSGIVGACEGGGGERCCHIPVLDPRFPLGCLVVTFNVVPLSSDQTAACRKCLACYATDLNNEGINVSGGPPYMCINRQAPVPQTGQTTCWGTNGNVEDCATDGRGQDGDIRAGVEWPAPRFTDNGEGQITDNLTGLVWLKDMDCLRGQRTWQQALDFANGLEDGQCGLTDGSMAGDWRLPNRNELRSLLDAENFDPALPTGHPFINVRNSDYWSSTTYRFRKSVAWKVQMNFGRSFGTTKSGSGFVTAVRDPRFTREAPAPVPRTGQTTCWNTNARVIDCAGTGQDGDIQAGVEWPAPRFTDNGNGTIADNLTGLIWLKDWDCRAISPASWQGAIVNVRLGLRDGDCGLRDGSASGDWRLPNVNELTSVLDLENRDPALPPGHPFLNVGNDHYWSSTTFVGQPEFGLDVFFGIGDVLDRRKGESGRVTAVRDPF